MRGNKRCSSPRRESGRSLFLMRSSFDRQLRSCFDPDTFRGPPPPPNADSTFPGGIASGIASGTGSTPVRTLQTMAPGDGLKVLLAQEGSAESVSLLARLTKADLETRCLRRAGLLAGGLFMVSFGLLGFCGLFRPDFFFNGPHFVITTLTFLCLTSLLCEVEFFGCRLWHHLALRRLRRECHQLLLPFLESQSKAIQDARQSPVGKC